MKRLAWLATGAAVAAYVLDPRPLRRACRARDAFVLELRALGLELEEDVSAGAGGHELPSPRSAAGRTSAGRSTPPAPPDS